MSLVYSGHYLVKLQDLSLPYVSCWIRQHQVPCKDCQISCSIALCVTMLCWMNVSSLIYIVYKAINANGSIFSFMCSCNTDV